MTETLKEKAEGLAKHLERFDLDVSAYSRGPLGSGIFTLNMSPSNTIKEWLCGADFGGLPYCNQDDERVHWDDG